MAEASVAVKMPQDAADDHHDHQQAGDGIQQQLEAQTLEGVVLGHITTALGNEAGYQHDPQPPQDAGHVATHEQCCDGDAAGDSGIDDQGVAWGDQHAGRGRGDVDRGAEGVPELSRVGSAHHPDRQGPHLQ